MSDALAPNQAVIEGVRHIAAMESDLSALENLVELLTMLTCCELQIPQSALCPVRDGIEAAVSGIKGRRDAAQKVLHPAMGLRPMPRPRCCDEVPA